MVLALEILRVVAHTAHTDTDGGRGRADSDRIQRRSDSEWRRRSLGLCSLGESLEIEAVRISFAVHLESEIRVRNGYTPILSTSHLKL